MALRRLSKSLVLVVVVLAVLSIPAVVTGQTTERDISLDFTLHAENPVLSRGPEGAWDEGVVWLGCVLHHEGQFHMLYAGATNPFRSFSIGYATSEDGLTWEKYADNPVLAVDRDIHRYGLYAGPCVVDGGQWVMYVQPRASASYMPGHVVIRATAPAPTGPWTFEQEILSESMFGWDYSLTPGSIAITEDETVLFYSAFSRLDFSTTGIGRATSPDGVTFTRYNDPATFRAESLNNAYRDSDPVFTGREDGWDAVVFGVHVLPTQTGWEMFYSAYEEGWETPGRLGYATSEDGLNWIRHGAHLSLADANTGLWWPQVVVVDDTYFMYSMNNPFDPDTQDIMVATGTVTRE